METTVQDHPSSQTRRRVTAVTALVIAVILAALAAWWFWPEADGDPSPTAASNAPAPTAELSPAAPCSSTATAPFVPTSFTVPGAIDRATVVPVPPVNGVAGTLPGSEGRMFAWEPSPGAKPGSSEGNVLLNVHTFPNGGANGNVLLEHLQVGEPVMLAGTADDGTDVDLCYVVSERLEVPGDEPFPLYYVTNGPPQVAIIVCSGERRGPGDWSHRTIWFASPVAA